MFYVVAGALAIVGVSIKGLVKRRNAAEIVLFTLLLAAAVYYAVMFALDKEAWSPLSKLLQWLDGTVGLSYEKLMDTSYYPRVMR
jgi:predicted MFS family arabinose efflux permease